MIDCIIAIKVSEVSEDYIEIDLDSCSELSKSELELVSLAHPINQKVKIYDKNNFIEDFQIHVGDTVQVLFTKVGISSVKLTLVYNLTKEHIVARANTIEDILNVLTTLPTDTKVVINDNSPIVAISTNWEDKKIHFRSY